MTDAKLYNCYHWLLFCEFFTKAELELITCMNGYKMETLNNAVFCRYGYRTVDDLIEEVYCNE